MAISRTGSVRAVVDASSGAIVQRMDYDAFGNVIREVTRDFGTQNGASVPEKQVSTEVGYATDADQRIFKLGQTVKRDSAGSIIMEMRRYYDGLPLGRLSKGLLTHVTEQQILWATLILAACLLIMERRLSRGFPA